MTPRSTVRDVPLFRPTRTATGVDLTSDNGAVAHVLVLEDDIVRMAVLPAGQFRQQSTWAIAPGLDDVPAEGRHRLDLSGFTCPDFRYQEQADSIRIETKRVGLTIELRGLLCTWEIRADSVWRQVAHDRRTQAYNFGWWDEKVYHYLARERDEMYFGLGERAGEMNRAGGRYRMCGVDCMGYNSRTSDPLYKHIPFYITWRPQSHLAFGLFYDTVSDCAFDMGREIDNYHGPYRYFAADHGDLDYYFVAGPAIADVTRRFTWLTGRPAFMPRWSLGYSGSTMSYTDAPNAQERMGEFLKLCAEHRIPCQSFHLSSGYTSINGKRCVFTWNREKFPDPAGFVRSYREAGVRLCPNIKPCLLQEHPLFEEAKQNRLLLADDSGEPAWVQFWDDLGAYLDFTNPRTLDWWKEKVKTTLLGYGIAATWNDNNEFEVWSPRAIAHGFGRPHPALETRAVQPLLMMRASREAQLEHNPGVRPFLVTRSGMTGMHRYAQTWSGDNFTSWETLKYNIKMGLGLALSGVSNSGHDVGGFSGPRPHPELFLRWVQAGIFMPRFSIHSWNDDGTANEPWMYPELTDMVRQLMELRRQLIPYFYKLLWNYRETCDPVTRPTFFDFPNDPQCYAENDDLMLGPSLLVASVVESGATARKVYLPAGAAWRDFWWGTRFEGGQVVELPAPWDRPVLLVREGSAIPINSQPHSVNEEDDRAFLIFPPLHGECFGESYEDDGDRAAGFWTWQIRVTAEETLLRVAVARSGKLPDGKAEVRLILPSSEARALQISGAVLVDESSRDGRRYLHLITE